MPWDEIWAARYSDSQELRKKLAEGKRKREDKGGDSLQQK